MKKRRILELLCICAICFSLYINVDFGIGISFVIAIISFIYIITREIKEIKNEKHWKKIIKEEISELKNLYNDSIVDLKKKRNKNILVGFIFCLIIILYGNVRHYLDLEYINIIISNKCIVIFDVVIYLACLINIFIRLNNIIKITKEYKKEIIMSNNMKYSEDKIHSSKMEKYYKCVFNKYDRIKAKDYATINFDNIYIEMVDICLYPNYGRRHANRRVSFTGVFMVLNTDKSYEKFEIRLNNFENSNKNESVVVYNQKFNKYFKVYANCNSLKYIATSLTEYLANFRERYGIDFEIIFADRIYIRFYTDNMFKSQFIGKPFDEYLDYKYYVITKFAREFGENFEKFFY